MAPRSRRALRALAAAATSTFVAAAFHVVGGGSAPGTVTLALTLALATLLCLAVQSTTLSLWRLAVSVVVSQGAFHLIFAITGSATSLAGHGHTASMTEAAAAPMSHPAATMSAAHLVAAAVTILFLASGERTLLAVGRGFAELLLRPARRLVVLHPPVVVRSLPVVVALPSPQDRGVRSGPLLRRGPPLFV